MSWVQAGPNNLIGSERQERLSEQHGNAVLVTVGDALTALGQRPPRSLSSAPEVAVFHSLSEWSGS